jgi:uncharacterized protein with von Willebrand factor type A (vWA) domain
VIHKSVQSGGTPIRLVFRRRQDKPLRLVAILDVSGSMSPYSTFFVRFLRAMLNSFREAERSSSTLGWSTSAPRSENARPSARSSVLP